VIVNIKLPRLTVSDIIKAQNEVQWNLRYPVLSASKGCRIL